MGLNREKTSAGGDFLSAVDVFCCVENRLVLKLALNVRATCGLKCTQAVGIEYR
jgi:hypothetical protein